MTTAYISHPDCARHQMQPGHPESPARLQAIEAELQEQGLWDRLQHLEAPEAPREALARVHSEAHIDFIFRTAPAEGLASIDPDTAMGPYTLSAALRAAGALMRAVDEVIDGRRATNAFCAVRPPGHHAERGRAMGFCFFNNIAVGVAHALEQHRCERLAILDFDVHHGNGTQAIFRDDPRVLFCSTHQHPYYPFTGAPVDESRIVNAVLPAGSGGEAFRHAVTEHWLPAIEAFKPELLMISAGFDAHRADPLAGLELDESDYAWVTGQAVDAARRHCRGRLVSTLEGGYQLEALARSVAAHVEVLCGM